MGLVGKSTEVTFLTTIPVVVVRPRGIVTMAPIERDVS